MAESPSHEVTALLLAWRQGDRVAQKQLLDIVYAELHNLAHRYMRQENAGHTLQTTALVNEAYIKLVGLQDIQWENRAHFFAISARMMRRILVDAARSRRFKKRGGGARKLPLETVLDNPPQPGSYLIALDDALQALAATDPRKSQVVELRYFGGLSVEETAAALDVSPQTVLRDWKLAKAWLAREIRRAEISPR